MNLNIGDYNTLEVVKQLEFGIYLKSGMKEILVPKKYVPENIAIGDMLEVFVYTDSEDKLIATTQKPIIKVDEFGYLKIVSVSSYGAFADIGLDKQILVPMSEQKFKLEEGKSYVLFMYLDNLTNRLVASAKLNKFLDNSRIDLEIGQEVEILVASKTDLGYNVIVEKQYKGLIYKNEIFTNISEGTSTKAFVKNIRNDNKIDIVLQKQGFDQIDDATKVVLAALQKNKGALQLTDNSSPEDIYNQLGISKKSFKKAIGGLYKNHEIMIQDDGIQLISGD